MLPKRMATSEEMETLKVKRCPECKSTNTHQMEHEEFKAYCLSCYNKFASYPRPIIKPVSKKNYANEDQKYIAKSLRDIREIKIKIEDLEDKLKNLSKNGKDVGGIC